MIRSMTGYGAAEHTSDQARIAVEMRSVNNRSLKLSQRTPEGLGSVEPVIERLVRKHVYRGTVKVTLAVEPCGAGARAPINQEVLAAYWKDLAALKERLGLGGTEAPLAALLALPGVVGDERSLLTGLEDLPARIEKVVAEALERLDAMREAEGEATAKDMRDALDRIEHRLEAVRSRAPTVIEEYCRRLGERAEALLDGVRIPLDDSGLAREVAFFAERSDINEELARMASHVAQYRELLAGTGPAGRRLEFLAQEMSREVNTIGAKSSDAGIAADVVEMKVQVDRLREHAQNVE
ncbi:MAG TPA: YicC/YloC family endoribonuclease [Phycisphaerae bacterium]|nr:YicC/YloC family endoribonuclease [Phycisphaerae bacterium]